MGSQFEVEVTVSSAQDLKNVNWRHGKLNPYAVVWIDPKSKCSTHVDEENAISPNWNEKLTIPFNSHIEDTTLYIDIVHAAAAAAEDTKPLIGSAKLRLRDIIDDVGLGGHGDKCLELKRPSGRPQGKVAVKVTVRDPRYRSPEQYYAPPPAGYPAYGAPQIYGQPGYGQSGYYGQEGYVGVEKNKSKFGGMGTGLAVGAVAGALGGLALAEGFDALEDDVADQVEDDSGYDGDDF
ncbi:hypothetical protein ACJIZ3_009120 [Penstemon smallii]|uniref:C2 domain-containing protein n=1 Tax=Penstemon smallii TaxID=265156 RepID=A0ABD3TBL3_9LAMI